MPLISQTTPMILLRETNSTYIMSSEFNQSAKDQYLCQLPSFQSDSLKSITQLAKEMKYIAKKCMSQLQISHQSSLLEGNKTAFLDKQNVKAKILKSSC